VTPILIACSHSHRKQAQRQQAIESLPNIYKEPISKWEADILEEPIQRIVEGVQTNVFTPSQVLTAYAKKTLLAQMHLNCLTEIMISKAETLAKSAEKPHWGPLAGVPVSLKDVSFDLCLVTLDNPVS
jgi:hypothetical protein